jgi:diguanylate cyclase (GGDEF)-like protein/PAS domain S-box-containing protein
VSAVIPTNEPTRSTPGLPPTPVLGRFGPIAVSVAAIAIISMGLIAWSHVGWSRLQQRTHAFDTRLLEARQEARMTRWLLNLPGASTITTDDLIAPLRHAEASLGHLQNEAPESTRSALEDALKALRQAAALGHEIRSQPQALQEVDQRLAQVTSQWEQVLDKATRDQRRLDRINVGLVGALTLLLLTLMARAHRQREQAISKLAAREAQLTAFAQALPDLAFRLDSDGRYLDIYGSNLPLLGRPVNDLIGKRLHDLFPVDMAERFLSVFRKSLGDRRAKSLPFSVPVDGSVRHFDSRCAPVGETDQVVWMIWDITTRRQVDRRLRRKTRMYDFLSHVNQAMVRAQAQPSLLAHVCEVAVQHGEFRKAWVALFADPAQPASLNCTAESGDRRPGREFLNFELPDGADGEQTLAHCLRTGQTHRTALLDTTGDVPAWVHEAVRAGTPGCVIVPLRQEQILIGHLILLGKRVDESDPEELGLFEDLSSDLSFALTMLHRESLRNQAEQRIRLHAAALESTQDGMMVMSLNDGIVSVNPAFTSLTGYEECAVIGRTPEFLLTDQPLETITEFRDEILRTGHWQGEVLFKHRDGEPFMTKLSLSAVHSAQGAPTHIVGVFTDITPLKQTEERLARMAHYDTLTSLPNRLLIRQRLSHAISLAQRHHTLVAIIFIDLDNFKTVNDGLGHSAGDSLLKQVAKRLSLRVRQEDTLGRLAGDEFVLILEHLRHPQQAGLVASAILETLNHPFTLEEGQQVYVRASIGISLYPDDGQDESELVRNADAAMYEAKRRGRNSFSFYTPSFTTDANERLRVETVLRRAVENQAFTLHYQPMVRLRDRRVTAVEALVRLTPAAYDGLISPLGPNQFIPVMEDTGMIEALGEWVMEEACRQARSWLDMGLDFGRMSINLSPAEIRRGKVVDRLTRILALTGLPPNRLEIEITESGLMESGESVEQFLHSLHAMGVHLSIDDFGTGYSSLAYLKRFPVQQLKIDRSFVQDLPSNDSDAQLVRTMIAMARGLQLHVVAEGVEMPDQEAFLNNLGCDTAQGFLYSRPVPADQIKALLPRQQ